jgi:hypothetical protein
MKKTLHKADSRGHANFGWLNSYHTFSFGNYYDPERIRFGTLRVLNDDTVEPGMGFGTHPHDNMEIISIPLEGALEHKDSMGTSQVIKKGDIQVMSAGTGIQHSEYNHSKTEPVKFLQIWIFPNKRNVAPRYDQITLKPENTINTLHQILSPVKSDQGVWIHQDAWFYMSRLQPNKEIEIPVKKENNGLYIFVLDGKVHIDDTVLDKRDGLGITESSTIAVKALTDAEILTMDVPLQLN